MRALLTAIVAALVLVPVSGGAASRMQGGFTFESPAWSPDGAHVAWGELPLGSGSPARIWTANADGSDAAQLIGGLRNGLFEIVWTAPDTLLYDANFDVRLARLDGTHTTILRAVGSTFTSDAHGTLVASAYDRAPGPLLLASTATRERTRIGGGRNTSNGDPTLSPDGAHIAFDHADYDPKTGQVSNGGLFVARADGAGMRRILRGGGCAEWSPRGEEIAFLTPETRGESLRVTRPDGSHERVVVAQGPVCSVPQSFAWSPDGTRIAYVAGSWGRLTVVDVAGGKTTPVRAFASVTGVEWSPDSRRLLVTARPRVGACSSLWTVGADGKGAALVRRC